MKAKLNTSEHPATNVYTTAPASMKHPLCEKITAIVASHLISNETISNDKQISCTENIQTIPFSKMLGLDLTIEENNSFSFSMNAFKAELEKLWLPTETDCADSVLSSLNGSSLRTMLNSWFSTSKVYLHSKNSSPISSASLPSFRSVYTDSENTVRRSRKIRSYPNLLQRQILDSWFGCSRYAFNRTLDYLKQPGTKANWKEIKTDLIHALPDWAEQTPYQIKSIAIRDCCKAVSKAKMDTKITGEPHEVHYRTKKNDDNNLYIPKQAVDEHGVYKRLLGDLFVTEKLSRPSNDCRLIKQNGRYFLCVPRDVQIKRPENQRLSICALDPGARTFQTVYSPELCIKIGEHDFAKIYRYCIALDKLTSRRKTEKKRRFDKPMQRIRWKIRNLVDEMHNKTALFLCKTFDIIYLPHFETKDMTKKHERKLKNKAVRNMLTWSHYRFKQHLKNKAAEYSCVVVDCDEAYTSKTCGNCGEINNVGGREVWKCKHCGKKHDRDINGARNIFIKNVVPEKMLLALRDPSTAEMSSAVI